MKRRKLALMMAVVTACSQAAGTAPLVMAEEAVVVAEAVPEAAVEEQAEPDDLELYEDAVTEEIIDEDIVSMEPVDSETVSEEADLSGEASGSEDASQESRSAADALNLDGENILEFIEEVDTAAVDAMDLGADEEQGGEEENPVFLEGLREENFMFIFEGETYTLTVNTDALEETLGPDYEVDWQVGLNTEEGLVPSDEYVTCETDGNSLTLTGIKETPEADTLGICAEIRTDGEVQASVGCGLDVRPQRYEYWIPECGTQLPYWWFSMDKYIGCWVENPDHPYGEEVGTEITDVTVTVDEGEADAVTVEPYDDGNGWTLHMNSYGHAVVTVTYVPIEGDDSGEYQFDFWISQDNWGIDLDSSTGTALMLPGASLDLRAEVWHQCYTEDQGHFDGDTNVELVWAIERGDDAVGIEPDAENRNICHVNALTDAEPGWNAVISVRAFLLNEDGSRAKDDENNDIEVAYNEYWVAVNPGYYNITPVSLERLDLAVGETIGCDPVLQNIWLDEEGTQHCENVENVQYRWEWDTNAAEITDANGKVLAQEAEDGSDSYGAAPFTIKKLRNWDTNIRIIAEVPDENGNYYEADRREWDLWEVDYNTWFEELYGDGYSWVYQDGDLALALNTENLDKPDITVDWTVGSCNEDGIFTSVIEETTGAYSVQEDGFGITLRGNILKDLTGEDNGVNVRAVVLVNGEEVSRADTYVDVRESSYELEDDSWNDTLVGGHFYYDDGKITCWLVNSQYPYGDEIKLTITDIISDNEEVLGTEKDEDGRWIISALAEGEATLTYVTEHEVLGQRSFERHRVVTNELYRMGIMSETDSNCLLPGASLQLRTGVYQGVYDADQGREDWKPVFEGYTLTYDYDPNMITVDENGLVTALDNMGDTTVAVNLSVPMEDGGEYTRTQYMQIFVTECYHQIITQPASVEPGETVKIAGFNPVLMEYTVDDPEGHVLEGVVFTFQPGDDRLQVSEDGSSITVSEKAVTAETSPEETGLPIQTVITNQWGDEDIIGGWCSVVLCAHDWDDGVITKPSTCTAAGERELTCKLCNAVKTVEEPVAAHTPVTDPAVAATCTKEGKTAGTHCSVCGTVLEAQKATAALGHSWNSGAVTKAATCTTAGVKTYTCTRCGTTRTEAIAATGHKWGAWQTVSAATVFAPASQKRTCAGCGSVQTQTAGTKLTPTITLNATSIPLKVKQSTTKVKVSGLAAGDYVKSWTSSNTKIVTVNSSGKITAKSKTGKAVVTVTLASGLTKNITVKVQKSAVKTTKVSGLTKKLTLQKGTKQSLAPVITPITSLQKVKYSSSNKKVATVNSKGVITAKKAGTAKITVKSGNKKFVVTVTVPKTPATGINKVPSDISVKKGKTYKLKPQIVPSGSEEKITYSSSNKKIAAVDKNGKITGKKKGTAVITVKAGKVKVTCTVTVK